MLSFGTGDFFEEVVKQQQITRQKLWESVGTTLDEHSLQAPQSEQPEKGPYQALLEYRDLVLSLR